MIIINKKQNHESDLFICLNLEVELKAPVKRVCSDFAPPDRLLSIA